MYSRLNGKVKILHECLPVRVILPGPTAGFKKLSEHSDAKRLSTAFDSVTLYGFDPAVRPDIYGKIGNSGVSVATLEDMKVLLRRFDLCDPAPLFR